MTYNVRRKIIVTRCGIYNYIATSTRTRYYLFSLRRYGMRRILRPRSRRVDGLLKLVSNPLLYNTKCPVQHATLIFSVSFQFLFLLVKKKKKISIFVQEKLFFAIIFQPLF